MRHHPVCGLFLVLFCSTAALADTLHVSPTGDDRHPGTKDQPLATLSRARDLLRTKRATRPAQVADTIVVHGGVHRLTEPLLLEAQDGGSETAPIVYAAAAGEKPILSGGRVIKGWKESSERGLRLWTTQIPEVQAGKWYFHQLWVDGKRRLRARYPNEGFVKIAALPDATPQMPYNVGQNRFQFAAGDLKNWNNLSDVDVVPYHLWVSVRLAVESVDESTRMVTFRQKSKRKLVDGNEPARYVVENARELLDTPGEWYLDRTSGVLTYAPLPGEQLDRCEMIAPVLTHLLRLQGDLARGTTVSHLTIRGLTFAHAEWWPPRNNPLDDQAAIGVPAVIQAEGARHCTIEQCTVMQASNYGIHLGAGCQHNQIRHCEVTDLGAGGIKLGETAIRQEEARQAHHNSVSDCHLHDLGHVFPQAVGLWIGQSYANRLEHNHIHDLLYTGISCGWTWGYGPSLARDNLIAYNRVGHIGKGILSDMGGIYTLGIQPGTVIHHNIFHDISAYRYGGWGIYFDEGSTNIVAEQNVVYRTKHGGFHQHYGKDNIVRNNVLALGSEAQLRRTRVEKHNSFTLERNLVFYEQGKLLDGQWNDGNFVLRNNLYWRVGGSVDFLGLDLKAWQGKKHDIGSLIADPRFVDARQRNFQLQDGSPARQIEFIPIETATIGIRLRTKDPK